MTLSSKTQRLLTSNALIVLTIIVAVPVAWLVSKVVKENRANG